jgi:hypothetical protein
MQAERSYHLPLQLQFNRFRDIALLYGFDRKGRQIDLIPTLREQSRWNSRAAWLAAGAAVFQAIAALYSTC